MHRRHRDWLGDGGDRARADRGRDQGAARIEAGLDQERGSIQPGFQSASSAASPQPDTLRIVILPTSPLESLEVVEVREATRTGGGAFELDTKGSFKCEDLTAPRVAAAGYDGPR